MTKPNCLRCGKCCKEHGNTLFLRPHELSAWRKSSAPSNFGVYPAVNFISIFSIGTADIFFHPVTGEELIHCPFLRKLPRQQIYECLLHGTQLKPEVCREFYCRKDKE